MSNQFTEYMKFVEGIERVRLHLSPHLEMQKQLDNTLRSIRADVLARPLAMDAILQQIKLTSVELNLIEALKPPPIDLAMFTANKLLGLDIQHSIAELTKPLAAIATRITSQQALIQQSITQSLSFANRMPVLAPSIHKALITQGAATEQLLRAITNSAFPNLSQQAAINLFVPQGIFAQFARATIERLGVSSSDIVTSALQSSLELAEEQLLGVVVPLSQMVGEAPLIEDDGSLLLQPQLVVPFVQQEELVSADVMLIEGDLDLILPHSNTGRLCDLARRVVQLIPQCNEAARIALGHEVFKPTNRCLESCAFLPWSLAKDKNSLGNVVDYLFWILYEGAGDETLRFHAAAGGPLTTEECSIVFSVKFLRNKWLRHDPDHGKEAKIDKSWKDVKDALSNLGLQHLPVSEPDFRFIHRRLLEEVDAFLKLLLSRLTKAI